MPGPRRSLRAVPDEGFASMLRRKRLADGLTQAELADRLTVRQQTIGLWERGDQQPHPRVLPLLAQYLTLPSVEELVVLLDAEVAIAQEQDEPLDGLDLASRNMETVRAIAEAYAETVKKRPLTDGEAELARLFTAYFS
jgi:transcriptional regulator with XRE-family HTH domain